MQAHTHAFGPSPMNERLLKLAMDEYKQCTEHSLQKVHDEIRSFATMKKAGFKPETTVKVVGSLRLINAMAIDLSRRSDSWNKPR